MCKQINTRKSLVECHGCKRWAHLTCVHLKQREAAAIPLWKCPECRGVTAPQPRPNREDRNYDLTKIIPERRKTHRTVHFIPRGARPSAAEALTRLLNNVVTTNSQQDWLRLLCYPLWALHCPPSDGTEDASLATRIKRQIAAYMSCEWLPDHPTHQARRRDTGGSGAGDTEELDPMTEERRRRRINKKFQDMDIRGAVREIASTEALAPFNDDTLAKLQERHPSSDDDPALSPPREDIHPTPTISSEGIRKAILSFPAGSAGGPDGLTPDHLKSLVSLSMGEGGRNLLNALRDFASHVAGGLAPPEAGRVFFGASLCAFNKVTGGVRPIAVGLTLRRMTTKALIKPGSETIGEYLRPHQLGYGTKGGCEAAVHSVRQLVDHSSERLVFIKLDIKNAFNSIQRSHILHEVSTNMPNLYKFFYSAYSKASALFFDTHIIESKTGVQQGDPGAPALFSVGIQRAVQGIKSRFNTWYLDDASLIDNHQTVLADIRTLVPELRRLGLEVNSGKCEIIFLNINDRDEILREFRSVLPDLRVVELRDASLLGAPLSPEQLVCSMNSKTQVLRLMAERLKTIDPHQAIVLLKSAFSLPKILYTLRSSPAYKNMNILREWDSVLRSALSDIANVALPEESWTQASLPVDLGGLGLRRAEDIALPAFLSSISASSPLVRIILTPLDVAEPGNEDALEEWIARAGPDTTFPEDARKQKQWDRPMAAFQQGTLLSQADQASRARLLAASAPRSGCWIHAIPVPALGTHLDPDSLRVAISLRIGTRVCEPHRCRCGARADEKGYHLLSCRLNAGRFPRHTALNDGIARALRKAGLPSVLEPPGLDRGDGKRPDGITLAPFSRGMSLCWDSTCVNTYAESALNNSALEPGAAASAAEESKKKKYRGLTDRFIFAPLGFETSGVFGPEAHKTILDIGTRLKRQTGEPNETLWLYQRLGLSIQRGNAATIIAATSAAGTRSGDTPRPGWPPDEPTLHPPVT